MRGKLAERLFPLHNVRITPAGAGKTLSVVVLAVPTRDHPRRCGENFESCQAAGKAGGSPPQVRGKHDVFEGSCPHWRITPAGAGKTTLDIIGRMLYKDHPRRCGENPT